MLFSIQVSQLQSIDIPTLEHENQAVYIIPERT